MMSSTNYTRYVRGRANVGAKRKDKENHRMSLMDFILCGGAAAFIVIMLELQFSWDKAVFVIVFIITFFLLIGLLLLSRLFGF